MHIAAPGIASPIPSILDILCASLPKILKSSSSPRESRSPPPPPSCGASGRGRRLLASHLQAPPPFRLIRLLDRPISQGGRRVHARCHSCLRPPLCTLGYGYGVEQSKSSPNSICFSIFSILASILCSVNLDDISCESVRVWVQAMEWSKCSSSHCAAVTFLGTVRRQRQTWWMQGSKVVAWQTRTVTDA
uniref:Uncharacterized protein n=1 Tax=Oryza nivara TaxID=4536 RepID=A0A0E0G673_ORYNI